MNLHQEDPRLTAYILGELSPEEALAVEHAVAGDPALRLVLSESEKTRSQLCGLLGGATENLLPRQREAIRRAAVEAGRKGRIEHLRSHRRPGRVWFIPMAAAAVVAVGIFMLTKIPAGKSGAGRNVTGNHIPAAPRTDMPVVDKGGDRAGGNHLPLHAAKGSLAKISAAVRVADRKPSREEVSVPGLLNAFPLKANGSVALKDGCKLGAEIIPCPWKPSGSLILVEIRGAKNGARDLAVAYRPDDGSVIAHRIIGYRPASDKAEGGGVSRMDPNAVMLLMIDVDAKTPKLGELVWSVDGETAPGIPLVRDPQREPSDDISFATLVCGFGLWLRGEDTELIDESMVLGLAREVAAGSLAADRYDFLNLVDQAMKLKAE